MTKDAVRVRMGWNKFGAEAEEGIATRLKRV